MTEGSTLNPHKLNSTATEGTDNSHTDNLFAIVGNPTNTFADISNSLFETSIALRPTITTQRMLAQNGVFTVQGTGLDPMEEEFNGIHLSNGTLKYIDISPRLWNDTNKYLNLNGVSYFSLFPDLDGLSNTLNNADFSI